MSSTLTIAPNSARPLTVNRLGYGTMRLTGPGIWGGGEEVLALCEQHGIPLIPFFSLVHGLPNAGHKLAELARQRGVSEAQLNIAWLLHRSPLLLPIPGTSSPAHLRENLAAAAIELSAEDMAYLG